jgi:hypothetical protein
VSREAAPRKRQYVIVPSGSASPSPGAAAPEQAEDLDHVARSSFGRGRRELIAEAAYYRSLNRGSAPVDPQQDWLEAEAEIEALLRRPRPF